jgi:hypothetical protein
MTPLFVLRDLRVVVQCISGIVFVAVPKLSAKVKLVHDVGLYGATMKEIYEQGAIVLHAQCASGERGQPT